MSESSHASHPPEVPADLLNARRANWHAFAKGMAINGIAIAALLVLMLLALKIF